MKQQLLKNVSKAKQIHAHGIKKGRYTVFYCNFKGLDPNKEKVEILARRN